MKTKIVIAVALAAVVAVALFVLVPRTSRPKKGGVGAREQAMEMLGACIARLRPDSKVLVLSNPFTKNAGRFHPSSQFERAGLRGLGKGLGSRSSVEVVFPEIRPDFFTNRQAIAVPPDTHTPLSFLVQPESVEQLAEAHPDCRVIVSLIGLPAGVDKLKLWDEKDPRSFALLLPDLRLLGPPSETAAAFQRGKLLAAVVEDQRSGAPFIVTRENIAQVLEQQPKVFGY